MQVEIKSRHFALGDEQKDQLESNLQKLVRFSPRTPVSARLTITHESGRFNADLAFFLKSSDFRAKAEGIEPELAADEAIENIRTQLQRYKGKIAGRKKGEEGGLGRALVSDEGLLETEGASLKTEGFRLKDLKVDDAVEIFRESKHPFFVFRNSETSEVNVVYVRDSGDLGLLQPTED